MKKKKKIMGFKGNMKNIIEKRSKGGFANFLKIPANVKQFKPETDSTVVMDILPYEVTTDSHPDKNLGAQKGYYYVWRPFKMHRGVGVDETKVICPTTIGKKCPICAHRAKLMKEDGDKDEIAALKAVDHVLFAVKILKVGSKRFKNPKVQVFTFSSFQFLKKLKEQLGDTSEYETFTEFDNGCSLRVVFGEGNFKNPEPTRFDWEPRREQYEEDVLDEVPQLDELLDIMDYEEVRSKFFEIEEDPDEDDEGEEEEGEYEEEEEEEEEEAPRKRKSSKISKKKKWHDEEEEEEEEEDDTDEEEEEEDEGEEEEEEPEEEEEEEEEEPEPPRRKKKKVAPASSKAKKKRR